MLSAQIESLTNQLNKKAPSHPRLPTNKEISVELPKQDYVKSGKVFPGLSSPACLNQSLAEPHDVVSPIKANEKLAKKRVEAGNIT